MLIPGAPPAPRDQDASIQYSSPESDEYTAVVLGLDLEKPCGINVDSKVNAVFPGFRGRLAGILLR